MNDQAESRPVPLNRGDAMEAIGLLIVAGAILVGAEYLLSLFVSSDLASFLESGFDMPLLEFFEGLRSPVVTDLMKAATFFGGTVATMFLLLGAAIASFKFTRNPRWPIFFAAVLLGAPQFSTLLKNLLDRPRPTISPLYEITSAAFPSGHATSAAACFGALAYFLAFRLRPSLSGFVWVSAAAVAVLVGLTRVYLGVHWPTDVVGGWLLGSAWVTAAVLAIRPRSEVGTEG